MEKQIILGLVGLLAAGKGTVAKYLQEKYNAEVYGFSKPLRDILQRLYLPIERSNLDNLSTLLRKQFGQNLLSETITHDIQNSNNNLIVLDGIRRFTDIESAQKLPGFYLVKIVADEKIRYERLLKREQNIDDGQKTFPEFQADNRSESNQEIPAVMEKAQFTLDNNGSLAELYQQIEELINKLK